ncbi:hypothetical protein AGMMS49982_20320 [Bacteroidia bacterium]|nr:hypothetical protein AGMMS49982_20320 [Bacteroidia bacterium]
MINLVGQYFEFGRLNIVLLIMEGIVFLFTSLFICFIRYQRLETQIKEDGIYVRYFPYQKQYIHLAWDEISKLYVRQYRPLSEYGGWGFNYGGYKKALTVSGKMGLQIEFTNGKKLLIGTQKPDELTELLNKMEK